MGELHPENLKPCRDTATAKARGKLGGIKSGQVKKEKKLMSQIMAEFLEKQHDVQIFEKGKISKKKMSGTEQVNLVIADILSRRDSASVSMIKTIAETTEGAKIKVEGESLVQIVIEGVPPEPDNNKN